MIEFILGNEQLIMFWFWVVTLIITSGLVVSGLWGLQRSHEETAKIIREYEKAQLRSLEAKFMKQYRETQRRENA